MAQENKHDETRNDDLTGEAALLLKKRARRRLIGAAALALFAAIVLPMVMDHQPAPPLKDIQVRIPSPDEGVTQRVVSPVEAKPAREVTKPIAKAEPPAEIKPEPQPEPKPEPKVAEKPAVEKTTAPAQEKSDKAEAWEVQLGAYQEPGRVKLLTGKIKELGIPVYTEKVDTPNGPRTRVRAGPFPTQEAAEKARVRVKIVGVDGPVAKKP
ncbi:MAG: SPOR domain-containing protein [Rhodocyclaceae bacterium]|nr:SPOR domain-containing protein [Rhodocyclaceae bacterium]MDZ4214117.1 SPOR domain-containing protein [Rhodocyclaceae bacterium]